ncbi:alanyl-tRNA editing protein Aarsd1-like isoform X3 [Simochromis diagramma]|uniref:alanyl-tRNA editing protein Aarsd1-like isoform X3 n=1 Tax=Simochromis diagramma TaxID=43689 RepID=UPI001A7EE0B5|nr:alanyl-tRNA editing protein Aarsd1-like isoform X3 [Simochromis diagramma]
MNKPKIVRPEESKPAHALWFDRKKYVTINFMVQKPKDVQVDIQPDKLILCCKNETDDVYYNELHFYDKVQIHDSRERVYDRTINVLLRKMKPDCAWPRLQKDPAKASWISVDFDNWRDWEHEDDEGKEEYDHYVDMIREMANSDKGEAPDMGDLSDFVTSVVSCCPAELKQEVNGKKATIKGFHIKLQDTILFPEGGGQPDDHGFLGDVPVLRVTRQGPDALHFVASPLEVGQEVQVKVDWERRFDHMQQHSGQHLITALADTMFGYKTTSWELGRQRSTIELDTPCVKPGQLQELEECVNEKIRAHIPVMVQLLSIDDPAVEKVRSRGLPEDHAGPIRIIDIEGIDANMCCGTHVSNLGHLQVIKLLGTEKGKKNKTNLIFLAGKRVLKYAEKSYNTERSLVSLLKTGPDEHVEAVDKLQKSVKMLQKTNLGLLRDMAVLIAQSFKNDPHKDFFTFHKKEGDNEFMNIIANEINTEETLVFLTVGEEKGPGLFLLAGPSELVTEMGPQVLELLQGKGAGKNGRFQGKANSLARRGEVEALLKQRCNQRSSQEE